MGERLRVRPLYIVVKDARSHLKVYCYEGSFFVVRIFIRVRVYVIRLSGYSSIRTPADLRSHG